MSPVMTAQKRTIDGEEEKRVVVTVAKVMTGITVLMRENDLQMIEVPSELLPEASKHVGAKLVWRMKASGEGESVERERFMELQRTIRTLFSKEIEFKVTLQYIKMEEERCKVSFVWTPLKQLLAPFRLISLDVYCGDKLLRIGVNADGGIHSVLDAEESELVISGLEVMQAYAFRFVARTSTGNCEGGTFRVRGLEDGLIGYGIYCGSQEAVMEARELTTKLEVLGLKIRGLPR